MIHSDWARDMHGYENYFGQLQALYGSDIDARGGYDGAGTPIPVDGDEYLSLLAGSYEVAVFYTHADWGAHYPNTNEVTTSEIAATPGGSLITFIGGCHSGDIHSSNGSPTIATSYVFATPVGLAATGTTWSYGPEELAVVNAGLAAGQTLGQAWFSKQAQRNTPEYYLSRYSGQVGFDPNRHMFGEILFGDPFVATR
jgi:hypothetical protein